MGEARSDDSSADPQGGHGHDGHEIVAMRLIPRSLLTCSNQNANECNHNPNFVSPFAHSDG